MSWRVVCFVFYSLCMKMKVEEGLEVSTVVWGLGWVVLGSGSGSGKWVWVVGGGW